MRVENFPAAGNKVAASDYVMIAGGCAVNAAIAIARLGGQTHFSGPLGNDPVSNWVVAAIEKEKIDCSGVVQVPGKTASVSLILIDAEGEKMIAVDISPICGAPVS